jgi:hypothetical protein
LIHKFCYVALQSKLKEPSLVDSAMHEKRVATGLRSTDHFVVNHVNWMEVQLLLHSLSIELSTRDIGKGKCCSFFKRRKLHPELTKLLRVDNNWLEHY